MSIAALAHSFHALAQIVLGLLHLVGQFNLDTNKITLNACRYRLVHLISPVLRLVLTLLAGAPGSSGLAEQATNFAATHLDMLARLLQEAASQATASWAPGDEELEMAALAVSLLSQLPNATRSGGALGGLRRELWRLWLVLAGRDRREGGALSSIVVSAV